jgi:hypothetical protein
MNVYDGALWSMVGALSEASVAAGSQRMDIPDLTAGHWSKEAKHPVGREI